MAASASEARVLAEGTLRWAQQSGSGLSLATGTTPPSGLFGFVQEGFSFTSAQDMVAIMERGRPHHWKVAGQQTIKLKVSFLHTASIPTGLTSSGTTVPMIILEHRMSAGEMGGTTGVYHQFYGVATPSIQFSEKKNGNTVDMTCEALAMSGANFSGYLS